MTFEEVRYRAGEYAGCPRANLSATDASLLNAFCSTHFRSIWRACPWPEYRRLEELTATDRIISKTVTGGTIGITRRITTHNPRETSAWRKVDFWDKETTLELFEDLETVWVDYMLEPADLASQASPLAYTIPNRLAQILILKGAASLLKAKSLDAAGNEFLALSEAALAEEAITVNRMADP